MQEHFQVAAQGHEIYDSFTVKNLEISLTKAYHLWQNETTKFDRVFQIEDYCGFGSIHLMAPCGFLEILVFYQSN